MPGDTLPSSFTSWRAASAGLEGGLAPWEVTLAEMLGEAGYRTAIFGKWHLGDNYPFGPEHRGFDQVLRHHGGAIGVLADYWDNCYLDDTYYKNGEPTKVSGYCTDVFFSAARQFIDTAKEQDKPFFVYLPTNAPHGPYRVPEEWARPYKGNPDVANPNFFGMIANLDENIAKLTPQRIEHVIQKVLTEECAARLRMYMETCVHCGLCADACHTYLAVSPYCWDCHVEPKGAN